MTTTTITLDLLKSKCLTEPTSKARQWMNEPHSLLIWGEVWTFATDGHGLVAVSGDFGCEPFPAQEAAIVQWLTEAAPFRSEFTTSGLLRPLGIRKAKSETRYKCDECNGTGRDIGNRFCDRCSTPHYCDGECYVCDGTGLKDKAKRVAGALYYSNRPGLSGCLPMMLGPSEVDGWILFKALHGLPDGPALVEHDGKPLGRIRITGDGWKAIVMPISRGVR